MDRVRPVQILLVEDNLDDVLIAQRALARSRLTNDLHLVRDGQEALDLLFRRGPYEHDTTPQPDLILLDLNVPKMNGLEVLERIRADECTASIPVIMLTASIREEDVAMSYRLGANTYIQKPVEFERFMHVVEVLGEYWIEIATLPPRAA